MAVVEMRKLTVIGLNSSRFSFIRELMHLGNALISHHRSVHIPLGFRLNLIHIVCERCKQQRYYSVICLKEERDKLFEALRPFNFGAIALSEQNGTPAEKKIK